MPDVCINCAIFTVFMGEVSTEKNFVKVRFAIIKARPSIPLVFPIESPIPLSVVRGGPYLLDHEAQKIR